MGVMILCFVAAVAVSAIASVAGIKIRRWIDRKDAGL